MAEAGFVIEAVGVEVVRPLRTKLLRPDRPGREVVYKSDACPTARHFAARDAEGTVVGIGSLHFEDRRAGLEPFGSPGMRIRGMAVEDAWRGKGVGAGILRRMLEHGRAEGIQEAWANARSMNLGFYERSGFRGMSSEFEIPGLGPHVVMACALAEKPKRKARGKRKAKGKRKGKDKGKREGKATDPGAGAAEPKTADD